jgi:hypothetical protein
VEILFAALGKKIGTEHPTRLGARPKTIWWWFAMYAVVDIFK